MRFTNKNGSKKEFASNKSEINNQSSESSTRSTANKNKPIYDTPEITVKSKLIENSNKIDQFGEEKLHSIRKGGSTSALTANCTLIK